LEFDMSTSTARLFRISVWALLLAGVGWSWPNRGEAGVKMQPIVARCGPIPGVLLGKSAKGTDWQVIREDQPIRKDMLVVALPDATIYSGNKAITMKMLADVGMRGPLPVFESAAFVHENPKVDMDVSLDRGIVVFVNEKAKGAAKVKLRFFDQSWLLTLHSPGTTVGMEVYGRHPAGKPNFIAKDGKCILPDPPTIDLYLLVLKGDVSVLTKKQEVALDAPPGPAKIHWDNLGKTIRVIHLDKLPPTLLPTSNAEKKLYENLCTWARRLADRPIDAVLEESLESKNPYERKAAAVVLGALDKLGRLVDVLAASKHADARDRSIVVLRNFIGRGPGQVEKVYDFLRTIRKLNDAQAKTALHLLIGFDDEERMQPVTYEVLIDCLKHSKLAVREAARWHLIRLVPDGKKINYDADAPPEERERAIAEWRALVPAGQLPPNLRPKKQ
jgi:hypothetical protein